MTDLGNQSKKKKKISIGKSGALGRGSVGAKVPPAPPPAWSLFVLIQVNNSKTSCFAVNDYTVSDS